MCTLMSTRKFEPKPCKQNHAKDKKSPRKCSCAHGKNIFALTCLRTYQVKIVSPACCIVLALRATAGPSFQLVIETMRCLRACMGSDPVCPPPAFCEICVRFRPVSALRMLDMRPATSRSWFLIAAIIHQCFKPSFAGLGHMLVRMRDVLHKKTFLLHKTTHPAASVICVERHWVSTQNQHFTEHDVLFGFPRLAGFLLPAGLKAFLRKIPSGFNTKNSSLKA